jgi:hypothetical protein
MSVSQIQKNDFVSQTSTKAIVPQVFNEDNKIVSRNAEEK